MYSLKSLISFWDRSTAFLFGSIPVSFKIFLLNSELFFICCCGQILKPDANDVCLIDETFGGTASFNVLNVYDTFIRTAAFDPTISMVKKQCPQCNAEYMTELIISANMSIYNTCKCGYILS